MKSVSLLSCLSALVLLGALLVPTSTWSAEASESTTAVESATALELEGSPEAPPEMIRAFLHLQEQVHATQLAVERTREEAQTAAARNTENINKRLNAIEDSLEKVRADSATAVLASNDRVQESNTQMLMVAGFFGLVVLAAVGMLGWFQMKAVSRLAGIQASAGIPALLGPATSVAGLSPARTLVNAQLHEVITRLEQRIAQMEGSSHSNRPLRSSFTANSPEPGDPERQPVATEPGGELVALIREGEDLLAREEAQKAMEHFDSILAKHPGNPEVLLHKGTALERLRRDQEAIECYDLAIQADRNLTMAWLQKGGVFNRMERFSEAMECYEQALRVQETRRSA